MIQVGDKVRFVPSAFEGNTGGFGADLKKPLIGTVVFIHPRNRWCRVEWTSQDKKTVNHECFFMEEVKKYAEN